MQFALLTGRSFSSNNQTIGSLGINLKYNYARMTAMIRANLVASQGQRGQY